MEVELRDRLDEISLILRGLKSLVLVIGSKNYTPNEGVDEIVLDPSAFDTLSVILDHVINIAEKGRG